MSKNTRKIEQKAGSIIREIIDNITCADRDIPESNTNISWDGDIKLYTNEDIDDKGNLSSIIRIQIKGRTLKKLPVSDKYSFWIDKKDLQNYLKENGTIFFLVLFNKNGVYKIFYNDLLPYSIRKYLNENTNSKNEIKVKLKSISENPFLFEKMLRNFEANKKQQEKISEKVFNQEDISFFENGKNSKLRFYSWGHKTDSIISLIGEETYVYELDENENVINIKVVTFSSISEPTDIKLLDKNGNVYYEKIDIIHSVNNQVINIGKCLKIYPNDGKFNIKMNGTLGERIKALNFLEKINEEKGFYINEKWESLPDGIKDIDNFKKENVIYNKINTFLNKHKIEKDIDLDKWDWKDINKFLIWIRAIDDGIPIKVDAFKTSVIGSIKIKDICFSIFAERKDDGKIFVKSLWNSNISEQYLFRKGNPDDDDKFESRNVFDFLNKEAYLSDDINFEEMKKYYIENDIKMSEEGIINTQALEAILAYDECAKTNLLEYADFLLDKIINIDNIKDIAFINKCQIKKRLNILTLDEKFELMKIYDRNDDAFYNISINLLLEKENEALEDYNSLKEDEKKEFVRYPIAKFLNL